ncbi:MAG: right-handed parallel beta-helix repeat-containing protein [Opitutaceae bacterium]|jgi:hypothetical protein|nr:right-handed parallel beta-helix repeat-containing protein [Opitutaceae bacterium]
MKIHIRHTRLATRLALLLTFSFSALQLFSPSSHAATITIPAGADQSAIQAAITGAAAGDTIQFTPGATYTLTQTLTLKDNITLDGNGCTWDATAQPNILRLVNAATLQNVTIKNATARNIMLRFWVNGATFTNITNVTVTAISFQDGKSESAPDAAQIDSRYIQIKAAGVTIAGCQFLRASATPGKAIQLYCAQNTTITGCLFGATRADGADSDTHGWFKTAINITADSKLGNPVLNTLITASKIHRAAAMDDAPANCDHGIYAHHFDNLEISGNTISGWPPSSAGGAIKIRNAQNFKVRDNHLLRSGILLYTYKDTRSQWLKNGLITDNTIKIDPWTGATDIYHGIGYWRNVGTPADPAEYSIRIAGNTLENGLISIKTDPLNVTSWNASNGGVFDNNVTGGSIQLKDGIAQSGNIILPALTPAPDALAPTNESDPELPARSLFLTNVTHHFLGTRASLPAKHHAPAWCLPKTHRGQRCPRPRKRPSRCLHPAAGFK